jgi:hypothetical protein
MQMLKKLSLAALVAMGSMSFAGATDLSSAIQGVQLNGFLRVRAYYHNDDNGGNNTSYNIWRTNAKLVFGVPVADNTKIVWRINSQTKLKDKASSNVSPANTNLTDSLFFVNYKKDAITANVGVIPLGFLPYASSDSYDTAYGAGADATYTIGDVTVAAGYVDKMFNSITTSHDVYTLGAIYKNKDLGSAQLWYARVTNVLKYDVMLLTDIKIPETGVGVKLDYAQSKLNKNMLANAKNHLFYNLALTANVAGVDAKIGYAATNDNKGKINTNDDSEIGQTAGELRYNIANMTDAKSLYAKLGYDVTEATNVYVAYNNISQDNKKGNGDSNEYEVGAKYKVNKKFGVSGYYDYLDMDNKAVADQTEARVEFKYSF